MIPNAIQLLHTTEAYKAAVMRLMVEEANFVARQLGLKERVPEILAADTKDWTVSRVPEGVGGTVTSANYAFYFGNGRLRALTKGNWFKKISPPIQNLSELADRPAILDSAAGAYAWSIELLSALSVNMAVLDAKYPPRIFQVPGRRQDSQGRYLRDAASLVAVPIFYLGWGHVLSNPRMVEIERLRPDRPFPPKHWAPVYMEILGTTKEIIRLNINDPSLLTRPVLQVANADELLGPLPSARHFVEELFGGKEAYKTIESPNRVEAWLLTSDFADGVIQEKKDRAGPATLNAGQTKGFSDVLLNFDSYTWGLGWVNTCVVDHGARLRFTRGRHIVAIRLCYECDILEVTYNGLTQGGDFSNGRRALVEAIQNVFPMDQTLQNLR